MSRPALIRLRRLPLWEVGLVLLALYLTAFVAILQLVRLLAVIGPVLSVASASLAVAWAFLRIARLRREDQWFGS